MDEVGNQEGARTLLVVGGDVGGVLVRQDGTLVDVKLCQQDGGDMLRGHGDGAGLGEEWE